MAIIDIQAPSECQPCPAEAGGNDQPLSHPALSTQGVGSRVPRGPLSTLPL